ncbi:hypothetical protein SOVF_079510 [Spinacia oleracea]|nr:hypothetical protein SOVF_079510 [Spinacia oleracea]
MVISLRHSSAKLALKLSILLPLVADSQVCYFIEKLPKRRWNE